MARVVAKVFTAHVQREGGGFVVRRPIGGREAPQLDPFLMLDHLGPTVYGPGEAVGAPDHPHRGFETVTYLLKGGVHHKDSAGNEGTLGPGWVQWMTAGSGVVHSEMPDDDTLANGGEQEGFQLWVNLKAEHKMIPPRYQDTPPEALPIFESADGKIWVKVIAGNYSGLSSPISTHYPMMYFDVRVSADGVFTHSIPLTHNAFAYVYRGRGQIGDRDVADGNTVVFGDSGGEDITIQASGEEIRCLLIAGTPLREPIARHGPFVMNTRQEIEQAFDDYRSGRLGSIAGADERYQKTANARAQQQKTGRWQQDL